MRLPSIRWSGFLWLPCILTWLLASGIAAQGNGAPAASIDAAALLRDLRLLSADAMEGRQTGTAGNARARALLVDRFAAVGLRSFAGSFEQPFVWGDGAARGVNVVGFLPGTVAPARYVVVTAHYDHIGVRDGRTFNGANDNASGAAALAVIAEYFVRHPPQTSMIFAAFDAEEAGLAGSRAFVRAPPVDRSALLINVNLDMIGRDAADTLYVIGTFRQPALKPLLDQVVAHAPVTLRTGHDDPRQGRPEDWTRDSDHWSFLEAGIPALYFGVEDYALHHHLDDDYESMTLEFYIRAVQTVVLVLQAIDRNPAAVAAIAGGRRS